MHTTVELRCSCGASMKVQGTEAKCERWVEAFNRAHARAHGADAPPVPMPSPSAPTTPYSPAMPYSPIAPIVMHTTEKPGIGEGWVTGNDVRALIGDEFGRRARSSRIFI